MTYQLDSNEVTKAVSVKNYRKKVGGFPQGSRLHSYPNVEAWTGAMRKKHGETMPIKAHTRGNPEPSKRELAQKKMNNSLAAKGSSKRIWVNEKGKARITTKEKLKKIMFQEKIKGRR